MQTIPITASVPSQTFRITLNETSYNMSAKWNSRAAFWSIDLADENDNDIINGISLRPGVNLLEPYNLDIGGLYLYDTTEANIEATLENIGSDVVLIHLTPDEVNELDQ